MIRVLLESIGQDIRYAFHSFRRTPGIAITAIIAIALGIGACAAVFSVVDRLFFRALPYAEEDRVVSVGITAPIDPNEFVLGADYLDWRAAEIPFESMGTHVPGGFDCDLTDQNPVRVSCASVEASLFPTLGVQPILGRNFRAEEDRPNQPRVVLLSYGLWYSRFAGDTSVPGRAISLDGAPATVVGVLPANFEMPGMGKSDIFVPQALNWSAMAHPATGPFLRAYARLKPGITIPQATAAMQPLYQEALRWAPPAFRNEVKFGIRTVRDRQVQDARTASLILMAAVMAVLLIACANVANLLLARAAVRTRELAMRVALGAGRLRLMRQLLMESFALSVVGGAGGAVLAWVFLRVLVAIAPGGIPRLEEATLDLRVLLFAIAVSLVSGLLFGIVPALHAPDPESLAGWRMAGVGRGVLRHSLVAAQIAFSLVLLSGAGLLFRTLWNIQTVPLGMRTESVLSASVTLGLQRYRQPEQQLGFFEELESRMRRLPGIGSFALTDSVPLMPGGSRFHVFAGLEVRGRPHVVESTGGNVTWRIVTPDYFATLGIPILRGRSFREEDRDPNQNTIIISDSLARRLFPSDDPISKEMRRNQQLPWDTVIGVAGNARNNPALSDNDDPEYYVVRKHGTATAGRKASVIVGTFMNPQVIADAIRSEVAAIDPTLPVVIETMTQRVNKLADRPRFNAVLLGLFAAIGVSLAAIGLYGVISFLVTQRTQEIGVRMALGATSNNILRLVFAHAMRWTAAGILIGLLGSLAATRWLRSLLYQVPARDPWTLAITVAVLLAVALLAAWFPSRRALSVDPLIALKQE
ncbi:MAG TPA: ABC transporter permease [Terriglobia bacterium]|nr:ABC transporter permease [Terriglobia bacterium]